jgi:hypothetical protein
MTFNTKLMTSCAVAALGIASMARADLINGNFEAGLTGWTVANQTGSDGTFFSQTGTASPVNAFTVPAPPEGVKAAMTDAQAGGSHIIYQDFTVPTGVTLGSLAFSLYLNNQATAYSTPANLDWAATNQNGNLILNQQARVDIITTTADPFSVAGADVLQNVFQTTVQTPLVTGYNNLATDITALLQAHQGQTLRLRFAETDNVNFFNFGVDNVALTVVPEPGTCLMLLGSLMCVMHRRRKTR